MKLEPRSEDPPSALLYLAEVLLLIEFTEAIIPMVYGLYNVPNRVYFPHLRDIGSEQLQATIFNVALYAAMELAAFIVLNFELKRKLNISAVHQLAFVLDKHRPVVQSRSIVWVVFMLQSTLVRQGKASALHVVIPASSLRGCID
ncbi:hypothetical protein Gpo141_00005109 [Globisporangium polare]